SLLMSIVLLIGLNLASRHYGPEPVAAYGNLVQAILYKDSGQPEKAAEHFWLALQSNPDSPLANFNLGELERNRGNYSAAVEYYLRENEIRPHYQTYRGLGICYREMGLHEKSVEAFNQAHIMNPEDQYVRLAYAEEIGELALASFEQQEWTLASERFLEAQAIAPENPFFVFGYAGAIWAMGEHEKADSLMIDLQSKHPDFIPAQQWVEEKWRPLDQ
ncbi:MAG TPA: tetratricopeptide repeat protein, partial [Bacteroidetes bacterium]|nr:tetratricopeptide repeat protein [Bacteroidota bacterium]HEX04956.1 tetratricopeptide repeat protein [Bacteroidota bacterium]